MRLLVVCNLLLTLGVLSCSALDEDQVSAIEGEKIIDRGAAKHMLRQAIFLNVTNCPTNKNAGLYAVEHEVPLEINRNFYPKANIENCYMLLVLTTCELNPDQNALVLPSLYTMTLRACNTGGLWY